MSGSLALAFDGTPAGDDLYGALLSLEVEEALDLPGAMQMTLPVSATDEGDLTYVSDDRFGPLVNVTVAAAPGGGPQDAAGALAGAVAGALGGAAGGTGSATGRQCIFDGYILSHKLRLQTGTTNATLEVWGQDASWLMNLEERVREWHGTDSTVAASIFADYGITPADANTDEDSASHTQDGHTLMQRGSDIRFLRDLARRTGKLCRVVCADKPGQRTGWFAAPKLDGDPVATLTLNDPVAWNVDFLHFEWDASRPTAVNARQALFNDAVEDGASGDASDSGLRPLGARGLSAFTGKNMQVLLTAPVDDGGELAMRARAVLRESGWFVRCEGTADLARLGIVLRAGAVVKVVGVGALHSGSWLVWSVRHSITTTAHKMNFALVRNAVGPKPGGGAGALSDLLNAL